ncbi:hypothetical protein HMPREF9336_04350 [Segniliparus rugosus ATCC BAA-974]|uniref:Uncharacterized protein n=1 Tax=Segniliparus rugosus (strain ATCC BAA-974 / DSM 45345 / CCUG 50838 / CIP 108380 / JCM 13579 / CDC 945) TaxID=679197 RepID=U1LMM8_SEGRC|nr:hypothetical protein HMPREF9336_04350 [Segniliparus rugosus ATCC BAA-974]
MNLIEKEGRFRVVPVHQHRGGSVPTSPNNSAERLW